MIVAMVGAAAAVRRPPKRPCVDDKVKKTILAIKEVELKTARVNLAIKRREHRTARVNFATRVVLFLGAIVGVVGAVIGLLTLLVRLQVTHDRQRALNTHAAAEEGAGSQARPARHRPTGHSDRGPAHHQHLKLVEEWVDPSSRAAGCKDHFG